MNRRKFLKVAGGSLLGLSVGGCLESTRTSASDIKQTQPNILLIMVDDMGFSDLGCYGGNKQGIKTPNIDRMAAEGMRFTQSYSGCTVCAPARSTLMTGKHMGHTTVRGNTGGISLKADDITIAQVLKKKGYATGGFGKWGIGDVRTEGVPEKHGFDVFFGYYHQIHAHNYWTDYLWRNSKKVFMAGEKGAMERYTHNRIFTETVDFIKENHDKRFFCYCPWTPPHGNYQIPDDEPALAEFKDKSWTEKAKVLAAMFRIIDRHVGEVLKLLKDLGIDEDTVVFFCSDNGGYRALDNFFNSNGPLRGQKTTLYEGGLRIPLIVRAPGRIKPSTTSDLLCYFPDIMPTLAELAEATEHVPTDIDGISIVPTLAGKDDIQKKHEYLYWEYPKYDWDKHQYVPTGPQQAVRMGKYKAVRLTFNGPFELYDLTTDVSETNNIADKHPDIVAKMQAIAGQAHEEPIPQIEPEMPEGKKFR